jgi:hypothetical protein
MQKILFPEIDCALRKLLEAEYFSGGSGAHTTVG